MLKKILKKDKLLKHVFTLVKGTVLAQIIGVTSQLILRRVFTPEDYGVFALYVSVVSILAVVSTGRYELAIVLPKKDSEANKLLNISVLLSFLFSLLLLIIILFVSNYIINFILDKEMIDDSFSKSIGWLKASLYLVPLGVFTMSAYNSLSYWFTRKQKYSKIVNVRVTYSLTSASSSASFGYLEYSFGGLILGYLFAQVIGILYFFNLKRRNNQDYAKVEYKTLMKNYIDFPTKSLFSGLLNTLGSQLPIILIASFFGLAIVAFYELIVRILNIPIAMIGKSISQVFYQKISDDIKNGVKIGPYVRSFSIKLFLFMLIPMSCILFFGEWLFAFAFGEEYRVSGQLASYFSIFFLIRFVYFSLSTLYAAKRKIGIELRQNAIYLSSQILALFVGYYYYSDFKITFMLLALSGFLCYSFFMYSLLKLANSK